MLSKEQEKPDEAKQEEVKKSHWYSKNSIEVNNEPQNNINFWFKGNSNEQK